jgi:hypothetical protein
MGRFIENINEIEEEEEKRKKKHPVWYYSTYIILEAFNRFRSQTDALLQGGPTKQFFLTLQSVYCESWLIVLSSYMPNTPSSSKYVGSHFW